MVEPDPPGPLRFLPNQLAPWRGKPGPLWFLPKPLAPWRRSEEDAHPAGVPILQATRLQERLKAKEASRDRRSQPGRPDSPVKDDALEKMVAGAEPAEEEAPKDEPAGAKPAEAAATPASPAKATAAAAGPSKKVHLATNIPELKIVTANSYGKVASYHIVTPAHHYSVWRKHADFAWLRDTLRRRYPGMLVPSIPAKLTGPASLSLCEPRRRLLRLFLERVGGDEMLHQDPTVMAFLSANEPTWAQFMKDAAPGGFTARGGAWALGCSASAGGVSEAEADAKLAAAEARFRAHEKHLKQLAAAAVEVRRGVQGLLPDHIPARAFLLLKKPLARVQGLGCR